MVRDGRVYVPFAPFPAIAFAPLVALIGPDAAAGRGQLIGSAIAAIDVGLCWWLLARVGVREIADRIWIVVLFAFSTPMWWITTRGGVWHVGQLLAVLLTLALLVEAFGRRRAWLMGLLRGGGVPQPGHPGAGHALHRLAGGPTAPTRAEPAGRATSWRDLAVFGAFLAPAVAFALWYNAARFGSPLESGYGLAALPDFLERQREIGLFSLRHLPMNLDYLFVHLPTFIADPPFLKPDGLGMSILLTSPGLLLALRADWRSSRVVGLGLTALAVLLPSLLYYGGGWLQYGYRYALDAIPFVMALVGLAVARRGLPAWGKVLIVLGLAVNLLGVYWAYRL